MWELCELGGNCRDVESIKDQYMHWSMLAKPFQSFSVNQISFGMFEKPLVKPNLQALRRAAPVRMWLLLSKEIGAFAVMRWQQCCVGKRQRALAMLQTSPHSCRHSQNRFPARVDLGCWTRFSSPCGLVSAKVYYISILIPHTEIPPNHILFLFCRIPPRQKCCAQIIPFLSQCDSLLRYFEGWYCPSVPPFDIRIPEHFFLVLIMGNMRIWILTVVFVDVIPLTSAEIRLSHGFATTAAASGKASWEALARRSTDQTHIPDDHLGSVASLQVVSSPTEDT